MSTEQSSSFSELGVPEALVTSLAGRGIAAPFPIQVSTLPDTLAGRDVLGRGRTGSGKTRVAGKTAAFEPDRLLAAAVPVKQLKPAVGKTFSRRGAPKAKPTEAEKKAALLARMKAAAEAKKKG